jgi:hypothetical protein
MSPTDAPSLFHVGYIKTATTYLQNTVFARPGTGLAQVDGQKNRAHLVSRIVLADDYTFDAADLGRAFAELEAPLRVQGNLPVWSEEVLLGDPLVRRYDGSANLRRIAAAVPQARILITIREQRAMVMSMYREYIKQGGIAPLRDFIGTGREEPAFTPILRPEFLMFDRAVGAARAAFGPDKVLVLPQEMLLRDPQTYFLRLGAFLDLEIPPPPPERRDNRGRSMPALRLGRFLNRFAQKSPLGRQASPAMRLRNRLVGMVERATPASWANASEQEPKRMIAERYAGLFTESNRALAAMTGLPLGEYGYM